MEEVQVYYATMFFFFLISIQFPLTVSVTFSMYQVLLEGLGCYMKNVLQIWNQSWYCLFESEKCWKRKGFVIIIIIIIIIIVIIIIIIIIIIIRIKWLNENTQDSLRLWVSCVCTHQADLMKDKLIS